LPALYWHCLIIFIIPCHAYSWYWHWLLFIAFIIDTVAIIIDYWYFRFQLISIFRYFTLRFRFLSLIGFRHYFISLFFATIFTLFRHFIIAAISLRFRHYFRWYCFIISIVAFRYIRRLADISPWYAIIRYYFFLRYWLAILILMIAFRFSLTPFAFIDTPLHISRCHYYFAIISPLFSFSWYSFHYFIFAILADCRHYCFDCFRCHCRHCTLFHAAFDYD
jgi:hypothetical protein